MIIAIINGMFIVYVLMYAIDVYYCVDCLCMVFGMCFRVLCGGVVCTTEFMTSYYDLVIKL